MAGWILGMGFLATARAQIYADVTLTGGVTGTFTITLEPTKAPVAVANFIGLATGNNAWIDTATGRLRKDPYYNGLTFHRVIPGFVSQTGSRNGNGTDGPGYTFANEIDPSLTHATPYTVAMANSGGIFSNGSQFYITSASLSVQNINGLNGNYTIFGRVTSGTAVCDALNAVPTDGLDKPLTTVTVSAVSVYGPSLGAFNLKPIGLPRVVGGKPVLKIAGASYSLDYDRKPFSSYFGSHSADLVNWSSFIGEVYFHTAAPAAGDVDVSSLAAGGRHFFQLPRVDYSLSYNPIRSPYLAGKTFTFPGFLGTEQMQLVLNANASGGTYTYNFSGSDPVSGNVSEIGYAQLKLLVESAYAPYLYVVLQGAGGDGVDLVLIFNFLEYTGTTSGYHQTLFYFSNNTQNVQITSGTFTSTP